jgi:hypothetical protein
MRGSASIVASKGIRRLSFDFRCVDRLLHSHDVALRTNQFLKKDNEGELAHVRQACSLIVSVGISRRIHTINLSQNLGSEAHVSICREVEALITH